MLYSSIFLSTVLKTRPKHILDSCCVKHTCDVWNIRSYSKYEVLCFYIWKKLFYILYKMDFFFVFYLK